MAHYTRWFVLYRTNRSSRHRFADLWLEQYRAFYGICRNQAEFKKWEEMIEPSSSYPVPKSSNTKAVFKSAKSNQGEKPDEVLSPKISKIEKPVHKSSATREKLAKQKRTKKLKSCENLHL